MSTTASVRKTPRENQQKTAKNPRPVRGAVTCSMLPARLLFALKVP